MQSQEHQYGRHSDEISGMNNSSVQIPGFKVRQSEVFKESTIFFPFTEVHFELLARGIEEVSPQGASLVVSAAASLDELSAFRVPQQPGKDGLLEIRHSFLCQLNPGAVEDFFAGRNPV